MRHYPIWIHQLSIAPEHQVFGKKDRDLSGQDLVSKEQVQFVADSGILGDRFFALRPEYNGHVTFFSLEVWDAIKTELNLPETVGPERTRRNIIVSGVDLKSLYGQRFSINGIHFLGTGHCAPCLAMNQTFGPAAREALRSRGGLRAQVKSNGFLSLGETELITETYFDPRNAVSQDRLPELP